MTNQNDDLAHEIWAAAQTPPGDSIEGAVARINALLSKLRAPVAELQWSEVTEPNEQIRYTHVLAESPLGRFTIEWKSWKPHDTFCVYLNGDYLDTSMGLDDAKAIALKKVSDMARALAGFAALASAPADPEAAEVDFLVRVLENLDTWRAEEWSELLERRPAILAMLRPMVLASAPVAGEAVAWKVYDAGLNKHMLTDNPKVAEMLREEGGGNVVRPLVYGDAAPQASEAVRDALQKLVDMYVLNQGSDHEHITCYTPLPASHLTPKQRAKSETWKAWDDARAALSAQPGAQRTGGSDV